MQKTAKIQVKFLQIIGYLLRNIKRIIEIGEKNMFRKLLFCLSLIVLFASVSAAQKVYKLEKGLAERTAVLNALRVPVEKELKQKIQFVVNDLNSNGTWAFLGGEPQNMKGGKPNYKGTPYQEAIKASMFDNNIFALLKKTGGKWKVITYQIGCTDVCYANWWKEYKAPKGNFPYTE